MLQHVTLFHARHVNVLENRYGGNLIVGSNPTPSATFRHEKARRPKSASLLFWQMWSEIFDCVAITTQLSFLRLLLKDVVGYKRLVEKDNWYVERRPRSYIGGILFFPSSFQLWHDFGDLVC